MSTPVPDPEDFATLPRIVLEGLEAYPDAALTPWQQAMRPYAETIELFWWACFALTLLYLITRFFLLPLISGVKQ